MFLKQSTAATVVLGPFVDETDGKTAETGLTISQADVLLSKNGGAAAQKNETSSCSHLSAGHYACALNTTDTNTLGHLRVLVNESGALPVWRDFLIIPANVYNALVAGSDYLDANLAAISQDATAADNLEKMLDGTGGATLSAVLGTNAITAATLAADAGAEIADAVWDEALAGHATAGSAGKTLTDASTLTGPDVYAEAESALADIYLDQLLKNALSATPNAGSLLGELTEDDAGTRRFTANALEEAPGGGSGGATAGEIADAVWDEAVSEHTAAGTAGAKLNSAAAAGDPWETALPGSYEAGQAGYIVGRSLAGPGVVAFTYTLTEAGSGAPIPDANVWVTSDADGEALLAVGRTDQNGAATFYLNAGTVYVWRQKSGWVFDNPDIETVS